MDKKWYRVPLKGINATLLVCMTEKQAARHPGAELTDWQPDERLRRLFKWEAEGKLEQGMDLRDELPAGWKQEVKNGSV